MLLLTHQHARPDIPEASGLPGLPGLAFTPSSSSCRQANMLLSMLQCYVRCALSWLQSLACSTFSATINCFSIVFIQSMGKEPTC